MKRTLRAVPFLVATVLLAQTPAEKKVALVIGNDDYLYVPHLKTAVNDARAVQTALQQRYGFETTLLLNATRAQIVSALNVYRRDLAPDSSLLIYYAGHGFNDQKVDKAYWWPIDAKLDDNTNWIGADVITTNLKGAAARHVLIVSDSCYSGMLRGVTVAQNLNGLTTDRARTLLRLEQRASRELLASGGNEPVSDSGSGGHSVFAGAFLRALNRMTTPQFAAHELFDEVLTSVAGNSAQTPQFDRLRDSGDDGGSFVFTRASGALPVPRPGPDRTRTEAGPTPTPAPPSAPPPHKFLPENPLPPPPEPGTQPLSRPHTALLVLHDNPKILTDEVTLQMAISQVAVEQSLWSFIAEALRLSPAKPQCLYEWQKVIDQRPDFARGPLIDVFNKADADWSFLSRDKGCGQPDAIDDVFMFSRDQVMGEDGKPRDNAFTARRVQPVVRKHLEAAAAKAPTKLWFMVSLPHIDYDFNSSALRFRKTQDTFEDSVDLLDPVKTPAFEPTVADGRNVLVALPAAAKATANYQPWAAGHMLMPENEPTIKPGVVFKNVEGLSLFSPAEGWRDNFGRLARIFPVFLQVLALDRQLRIGAIPIDANKAEAMHPLMAAQVRAQVFIEVEHAQTVSAVSTSVTMPVAVLFAKVTKVKLINYLGEVMVTLEPKSLPLPGK